MTTEEEIRGLEELGRAHLVKANLLLDVARRERWSMADFERVLLVALSAIAHDMGHDPAERLEHAARAAREATHRTDDLLRQEGKKKGN